MKALICLMLFGLSSFVGARCQCAKPEIALYGTPINNNSGVSSLLIQKTKHAMTLYLPKGIRGLAPMHGTICCKLVPYPTGERPQCTSHTVNQMSVESYVAQWT